MLGAKQFWVGLVQWRRVSILQIALLCHPSPTLLLLHLSHHLLHPSLRCIAGSGGWLVGRVLESGLIEFDKEWEGDVIEEGGNVVGWEISETGLEIDREGVVLLGLLVLLLREIELESDTLHSSILLDIIKVRVESLEGSLILLPHLLLHITL
jgi:hypothetical protein